MRPFSRPYPRVGVALTVPALLALTATGCYRATGFQRTTVVAEAIPEAGGDRVAGLKSTAGPGDYYLGNDFVQIAIDGTRWGDASQQPIAGAASGGSIVDAGYVALDTSYQRVNMPADTLERLTPVVNQDPDLQLVFDTFEPETLTEPSTLTMRGRILDRAHKIPGAAWDDSGRVLGVSVVHVLSLAKLNRYVLATTTIVNESGSPVGVRSIGDALHQTSSGYRFCVPAGVNVYGQPLNLTDADDNNWGVRIPGSDFGNPIATSVQSPMVVLMAVEPSAGAVDSHASIGIMSQDAPALAVAADRQDAQDTLRPSFPERLVAGSLPLPPAGLAAGASLSYNRRLYILGGISSDSSTPNHGQVLFDEMALAKYNTTDGLWPQGFGQLQFSLTGSAMKQGPLSTEVRVERNAGQTGNAIWIPERVVWLEPGENITSISTFPSDSTTMYLPVGTYRIVVTNKVGQQVKYQSVNSYNTLRPLLSGPIAIFPSQGYYVGPTDYLCPEAKDIVSSTGSAFRSLYAAHLFDTREADAPTGNLQPMRFTFKGTGITPDPELRRTRTLSSYFDAITKKVAVVGSGAGQSQFRAGNEMFGTGFFSNVPNVYFWLANGSSTGQVTETGNPLIQGGTYRAYATHGPLSNLQSADITAYEGQTATSHSFIVWPRALPAGWTTFDVPGPSQASGGGYLPVEKLVSALAEAVQVVASTEKDLGTDGNRLYNDFRTEFDYVGWSAGQLSAVKNDPFVMNARTSELPGYGAVTALSTPAATAYRFGGALQPENWTLSDFITQAKGSFTIVHRPRGASGLFTLKGFDPAVPVGTGVNAWWNESGFYANGTVNGAFDAIELLRGEGFVKTAPDPWFQEFLQVRSDWFGLLNQQTPAAFTKALGLSSAKFSLDTPVGLARTYLKATPVLTNPPIAGTAPTSDLIQDLSTVSAALKSGAAVASTGPFLDVTVGGTGPGGLVKGPMATANVVVNLYRTDWMPVDQVRIVVNGVVATTLDPSSLTQSATDNRLFSATVPVALPTTGTGAWIVVEAGVPLDQTGPYRAGTPWYEIMRGIYPIAVTNPIFIDVTGTGYTHP
ncbi:CehA/McbA family metallohydrolase domain-containing protein [Mesoterricola silvestris]|uniref:hypothetical protein n=1 Tax=Mesoterricola silvestris TaxID=2927979 RepID=UPI00292CDDDC|nr:hypothetical protein [Mesoterricola silvestris]